MSALDRLRALLRSAADHERTVIMGVLNVTPDSFSDGGSYLEPKHAIAAAAQMMADGADIIDVGGESTRPATFASRAPLPAEEERRRILPVLAELSAQFPEIPLSVDTYKADVAAAAVSAGAVFVNDVSAMRADPEMAAVVAELGVPVCLMHMPGLPTELQQNVRYGDVVSVVREHLRERVGAAAEAGIAGDSIVIDPGFGFGKSVADNLALIRRLSDIAALGCPVLMGVSRKSTIGTVLGGLPPQDRLEGTAAAVAICIANGASIVRVHDVREMSRVARMADAIVRQPDLTLRPA